MGITAIFGGTFNPFHIGHYEILVSLQNDPEIEEKMQSFFLEFVKNKVNKNLPGYKAVHKITIRHREFDKTTTQKIKRMSEDNLLDD